MTELDSKPFEAKYAGYCNAQCEERIEPGQRVMYVGTVLVHEDCAKYTNPGAYDKATKFQGTSLDEMGY